MLYFKRRSFSSIGNNQYFNIAIETRSREILAKIVLLFLLFLEYQCPKINKKLCFFDYLLSIYHSTRLRIYIHILVFICFGKFKLYIRAYRVQKLNISKKPCYIHHLIRLNVLITNMHGFYIEFQRIVILGFTVSKTDHYDKN